ncbi:MAG: amidohydrolase [Clostridia bacterium]|nr:amidohydrolase [Clostridia bacterium]
MRTIYTGGQVFTGALPLAEAFIVEDGCFLAVGTDAEILSLRQEGDAIVPLEGSFVCPGFNDSHMHLLNYGNTMEMCDLTGAATTSLAALQAALRAFAAEHPDGWLLGRGWNQDYFSPAGDIPTRHDLDAISADRPICITRCCGHCLTVNTRALELLGLDANTPVPEGGAIDVDAEGNLTGVFRDTAMVLVQSRLPKPTRDDMKRMIRTACKALNSVGVTSCQSDDFCCFENVDWRDVLAAFQEVEQEGGLTVRIYEQSQFTNTKELQTFLDMGYTTGVGSEMFKIGPLKMLGDGSLGARTAYLSQSYADAPEEKGIAIFTQEQFNDMVALARSRNMSAAIHAIGDGILDRVLNAYEYAAKLYPDADVRSGVVHVQLTRPDQLQRMKELGLHAYVQTIFIDYDSHIVHERAGEELAGTSYAFRTMQEMNISVSNGTDCPVENPNPMRGLQCAVTRQPLDGSLPPYRPEEAMSIENALQIYTTGGAYASREEDVKGCIVPGMLADFAVLAQSPFDVPTGDIHRIQTRAAYLAGRCVHRADGL